MEQPGNYVRVYFDADAGEWKWSEYSGRGNLPDEMVSTSGEGGYSSAAEANAAAMRENPYIRLITVEPKEDEGGGGIDVDVKVETPDPKPQGRGIGSSKAPPQRTE